MAGKTPTKSLRLDDRHQGIRHCAEVTGGTIGPNALLARWPCGSSCDVLDLFEYVLVAVFQRRLVHDYRFASRLRGRRSVSLNMRARQILFLCSGNYYRSRFAEELFNHAAKNARLDWRASSRGLALDPKNIGLVSHFTDQALADRGITPSARLPLACAVGDLESSHLIVAMKEAEHRFLLAEKFPGWENRVLYWHVHDVDAADPVDALATIDLLVLELVLAVQKPALVGRACG
jgi:protein-tyrosine phosphatase